MSKPNKKPAINSLLIACFLLGLLIDLEDGSDTFLRNVSVLPQSYTVHNPEDYFEHQESYLALNRRRRDDRPESEPPELTYCSIRNTSTDYV
jgi:hypothetical protein